MCGRTVWGVAKLVKAPDFDSGMRRFESFLPSQFIIGLQAATRQPQQLLNHGLRQFDGVYR